MKKNRIIVNSLLIFILVLVFFFFFYYYKASKVHEVKSKVNIDYPIYIDLTKYREGVKSLPEIYFNNRYFYFKIDNTHANYSRIYDLNYEMQVSKPVIGIYVLNNNYLLIETVNNIYIYDCILHIYNEIYGSVIDATDSYVKIYLASDYQGHDSGEYLLTVDDFYLEIK